MKKIYLLILSSFLLTAGYSQSPRLVFVEEFTGETCGPCAANNPGFNAILETQVGQVISLKYQNNIPSAGPNFYAYNSADISNRTTYYANNYSPHVWIDGNVWNGNSGSYSVITSTLNSRLNVSSPFTVDVTHSFSAAHDIIYLHAVIRASQAYSGTTLKARIGIAERSVYGYTSPNGESEFSHVMRKLLPNGNGVALPSTWASGDSVVLDYNWTITVPTTNAVDEPLWAMLEGLVWIQEDATGAVNYREILQSGISNAVVTLDPGITSLTNVSTVTCANTVDPVITVSNNEPTVLTSMDIQYYLDAQSPGTYNWTGSLAQGATATINLPSVPLSTGAHMLNINITNANGTPDVIPSNNSVMVPTGQPIGNVTSFSENFLSTTFPPVNWLEEDHDNVTGWLRSTASTTGSGSAKIDFYNSPAGEQDNLYPLSPFDLTAAVNPTLTFNVAHRQYPFSATSFSNDLLEVVGSSDCGQNWTILWTKSGATLATTPVTASLTSAFTPTATQWRAETVDLSLFTGQPNVLVAFRATSDYGNNGYVDDINLNTVTSVSENQNDKLFSIYPIPSSGNMILNTSAKASSLNVEVTSISGKSVMQQEMKNVGADMKLDLTDLQSGSYFVRVTAGSETSIKKIVIEK
jgi:hypothetical protein